jgi:hypothetical protein
MVRKSLKTAFFIIFFSFYCLAINGQSRFIKARIKHNQQIDDKAIRFGFCLGFNTMNFAITHSQANYAIDSLIADISNISLGFQIQGVSIARLTKNMELRFTPGISFGHRELSFYRGNQLYMTPQRLESSYIDLPLALKYKSTRINNYRAFLIGGLNSRFDMSKTYREESGIFMDLKTFDLSYEFGAGYDLYFPYFKLSVQLRGSWGVFNVLKPRSTPHPEFQNAISKLRSSVYLISFYVE